MSIPKLIRLFVAPAALGLLSAASAGANDGPTALALIKQGSLYLNAGSWQDILNTNADDAAACAANAYQYAVYASETSGSLSIYYWDQAFANANLSRIYALEAASEEPNSTNLYYGYVYLYYGTIYAYGAATGH